MFWRAFDLFQVAYRNKSHPYNSCLQNAGSRIDPNQGGFLPRGTLRNVFLVEVLRHLFSRTLEVPTMVGQWEGGTYAAARGLFVLGRCLSSRPDSAEPLTFPGVWKAPQKGTCRPSRSSQQVHRHPMTAHRQVALPAHCAGGVHWA